MKKFNIAELVIGFLLGILLVIAFIAGIYDTYYFLQGPLSAREHMKFIIGGITFSVLAVLAISGWIYTMYKKHMLNKKPA